MLCRPLGSGKDNCGLKGGDKERDIRRREKKKKCTELYTYIYIKGREIPEKVV
jgi:hypothetical protein